MGWNLVELNSYGRELDSPWVLCPRGDGDGGEEGERRREWKGVWNMVEHGGIEWLWKRTRMVGKGKGEDQS